jgi:hypothetical protein
MAKTIQQPEYINVPQGVWGTGKAQGRWTQDMGLADLPPSIPQGRRRSR